MNRLWFLGLMGALIIKTTVSIVIGLLFQSVPAQFRTTTLPIGEYAAITLLLFFCLQSIREAWKLPPTVAKTDHRGVQKSKEPAEEMSVKLSPIEVLGESFSLVFFAEWGDRSMLATMALGAAPSPLGVASVAISGHLLATFISVLGGSFLSRYISEKLSGYICGALFLVFTVPTFFGVF
ncbi:protein PAM71-homolog, chloroplastic-like [Primulina eburnea]|uniref:protein PAM71-homolog, chloroplastic-like n=1 Tax=Primulina eburnea TaxID=1245227 RepID=UPI003C6C63AE